MELVKFDTLNNLVYKYNTIELLDKYVIHNYKILSKKFGTIKIVLQIQKWKIPFQVIYARLIFPKVLVCFKNIILNQTPKVSKKMPKIF